MLLKYLVYIISIDNIIINIIIRTHLYSINLDSEMDSK